MGKVRISLVKNVAVQLVAKYPDKFSNDFVQNKRALDELKLTPRLRNRIAGYISTLLHPKAAPTTAGEEKPILQEDFQGQ